MFLKRPPGPLYSIYVYLYMRLTLWEFSWNEIKVICFYIAGEIEKHLQAEQNDSAVKIQAVFRGYITRKKMAPKFEDVVINQAAMKIQRGVS